MKAFTGRSTSRIWHVAAAAVAALAFFVAGAMADDLVAPVRFRAFMVNTWNGRSGSLDVIIKQWSPLADAGRLAAAVDDGGTDALVRVLEKMPRMGSVSVPGFLGLDIRFARQMPGPEKTQQILIIAERILRFGEVANGAISAEYPLEVVQLQIKPDGVGTGTVYPVARINYWDPKTQLVFVDSYTLQPVQLPSVHVQRAKT